MKAHWGLGGVNRRVQIDVLFRSKLRQTSSGSDPGGASAEFAVEYHHDPKNKFKFKQDTPDDVWLPAVAGEGWIVLSHDRKFHTLLPERSAIQQHEAGCFYLPGANDETWDKLRYFTRAYDGMLNRVTVTAKPFIFEFSSAGRFKIISVV